MRKYRILPLLILLAVLTQGCAKSSLVSSWVDDSFHGTVPEPVLVVGVFNNPTTHKIYENSFVDNLTQAGVHALPSSKYAGATSQPGKKELAALIQQSGAQAVLITHFLSKTTVKEELPPLGETIFVFGYWDSLAGYQSVVEEQDFVEEQNVDKHIDLMEAVLFDVKTGKRIWAARSKSVNLDNFLRKDDNQLESLFIQSLRKHNLL